ncbi:MAG TPA: 6-pyruvoyl tetrahydrobiopterin synthase [Chloroflexi bacterium]|jgi:6-pyruvoyltetrahydropterin/6-carboxytetrahydropterin synthase|nr:6-pyruvoyl tetrahydrobiopterin synthase [Chloroflexota bacterium]
MTSTTVRITRRATFAAAHVLCRPEWSEARNQEVFGLCSSDHGHNYVVEVTVAGTIDPETGMVANLKDVDRILRREFIDLVDHKHLNRDVECLRGVVPTAENIAITAFTMLSPHFAPARLVRLRLTESENNAAEINCE